MHPLHDYVARQLAEKLKSRSIIVWYDPRREFASFVYEVRGDPTTENGLPTVTIADQTTRLAEYDGAMMKLRAIVEPYVSGDAPENVLIYLSGEEHDRKRSVLMELEKAGECWEPQLKQLARNLLRQRYTDGVVDEILAPERVTYDDLVRALAESPKGEVPFILRAIFHDAPGSDGLLAAWLSSDGRDEDIQAKEAIRELKKLILSRLGLELADEANLAKLRSITLRYVLANEFRGDLGCPPPSALESVATPGTKDQETTVRELCRRLRSNYPDSYPQLADRVETELGLSSAGILPEFLGAIDTFRFEERALLGHVEDLIGREEFNSAIDIIEIREDCFWLDRDVSRKAQWEACRRMAELGTIAERVGTALSTVGSNPNAWIDAYTTRASEGQGWYLLDLAQRRLEAWVANLDEEPDERPLGIVRRSYEDACQAMADRFTKALVKANWITSGWLHQTHTYSEVVTETPKPVAYFLVDAMRFEMGVELSERLPHAAEVTLRPAIAALPSITPIGMAALQPGASASFSVVDQGGKLGSLIEDAFLPDLTARRKFTSSRLPQSVDVALDELLSLSNSKLAKKVKGAEVVIVRSQEIDAAGEHGFTRQARRIMDEVIGDIASAIQRLARVGIESSVISADHGHLFYPADRDESMRIDAPGGQQIELHRRCWVGRGGSTPAGCVRVNAAALGYASNLDFVFPSGIGVFKAGGDLAFHHGGPSLQELIVPVLTVRMKAGEPSKTPAEPLSVRDVPDAVTNRIFSVTLELGAGNLALFSSPLVVRPILMSSGRQVGAAGMVIDADFDRVTGTVSLQPGKQATVAFQLSDESVGSLRVVVQDPTTDAEMYRSPAEIPIRLGV